MIHRRMRNSFLSFFMALVLLSAAFAQEMAALPDEQVTERLSFVQNALSSAQPGAKVWWYGWISAYSAGTIVQWSLAKAHWNDTKWDKSSPVPHKVRDRGFAEDMLVGGATTALGIGGLLIDPFIPAYGPNKLRLMPEGTPEERRTKLLKAEELLRQCAQREKDGRSWTTHLLNIGVNVAAGLATTAAFHRPWTDGLITFAAGEAVSLLNIYTQPRRAIRDLRNYEIRYRGRQDACIQEPSDRKWFFSVYPGGFSAGIRF